MTALHAATHCCENSLKTKRESIDASPDRNNREETKRKHIEIVNLLCKAGARVNCKDSKNLTALHYACRSNSEVLHNYFVLIFSRLNFR